MSNNQTATDLPLKLAIFVCTLKLRSPQYVVCHLTTNLEIFLKSGEEKLIARNRLEKHIEFST